MKSSGKLLTFALCAALTLSVLPGCGNDGKAGGDGVKTVTVWTSNSHSKVAMNELVNQFNETTGKQKNIKIEYTVKEGDAAKAIDMSFETDEEPDFCTTFSVKKYSEQGKIVALEELPGGEAYAKSFGDVLDSGAFSYNGKTYKVPFNVTTFGLVYNKDMFKKYGIVDENGEAKPPQTLEELREDAKKMTDPSKQEYGIIIPLGNQWMYQTDISDVAKASGECSTGYDFKNGKYSFESEKPVYEMYLGIKEDQSFFPGADGIDNDLARAQFAEGKVGMKFGASYDVGVYSTQFPAKCDWGVAPMPLAEAGSRYKTRMACDGFLVATRKGLDKLGGDVMIEVYKWFHSDEMLKELYQQGIEIPYKAELVDGVKLDGAPHGWNEFASLVSSSMILPYTPGISRSGERTQQDIFLQDIWSGKVPVGQAITQMDESFNKSLEDFYKNNPNEKQESYVIPDFETKMKQ